MRSTNIVCKIFFWISEVSPMIIRGTTIGPNFNRPEGKLYKNCFHENTHYFGNDMGLVPDVESVWACQDICQTSMGCRHFTYNGKDHPFDRHRFECILKTGSIDTMDMNGATSGPKMCS
ncbi:hypothetical protein TCAL_10223 [Tigriopus californicus]|uniref:Apple domain-containing protein n=1 Tax=Tigriopus californicus TaxID=6832 RepID=A0A553PHA0_TIGCA|nr:hypothetical protein TCAL_10223 [Tigriopus californicus]|eukprot:TCALIF_10223-PA protein Name:"Protein of unknown function" AED:0.02 eAED:0.02 QI:7/1/0/1/0/0/2/0/118